MVQIGHTLEFSLRGDQPRVYPCAVILNLIKIALMA
jgi:hypothetical protein